MTLAPGTRLGPYEILSPLGAGGMGEVWKAKDARLDRFVAIKVLPEHLTANAEALARFEREAKAVAALNHPGILGIFDIGNLDGNTYAVMELLEGESLRERLAHGPLPPRKATELAVQLAHGLAAAHEKGVVHRDLKPDNLWISKDGRLKILDFGLAKQIVPVGHGSHSFLPTEAISPGHIHHTGQDMILGTVGYMSPEQVRGEAVDARSDIFAFGAVLYEMLTGRRAFSRGTAADTLAAILKEDPPELEDTGRPVPPGLQRVLNHCLEKDPAHRFQETHDLAFALENLSTGTISSARLTTPFEPQNRRTTWTWAAVGALAFLGAGLAGWLLRRGPAPEPALQQITFRRGHVLRARFTPDGQGVYYSATWDGETTRMFRMKAGGGEATTFGPPKSDFLAVGRDGQVLFLQKPEGWGSTSTRGTLALLASEASEPRALAPDCVSADLAPDGSIAASFPGTSQTTRLEWPLGTKVLERPGLIRDLRVSPDGRRLAFWFSDPRGDTLACVDREGRVTELATFQGTDSLCWTADGRAILTSLPGLSDEQSLRLVAVDLKGRQRIVRVDSALSVVQDMAADGRLLWERELFGGEIQVGGPGRPPHRVAVGPTSLVGALSQDGRRLLVNSTYGKGALLVSKATLADTRGGPAVDLGSLFGLDISPDGTWVLALDPRKKEVSRVPLKMGLPAAVRIPWKDPNLFSLAFGKDAGQILGSDTAGSALWRLDLGSGEAKVLLDREQVARAAAFIRQPADPGVLLIKGTGGETQTLDLRTGGLKPLALKLAEGESVVGWSTDGRLVVRRPGTFEAPLDTLDPATGARAPFQVLKPPDLTGLIRIDAILVSPDRQTWAFTCTRITDSNLFVVKGLQ